MAGLVPFNRRRGAPALSTGLEGFYNMLDDFFSDSVLNQRSLARDTFKIDVEETEAEYLIHAEVPGVKKEEISLEMNEDGRLIISINREENTTEEKKNYIHKERRSTSMSRGVYLADGDRNGVKAKLTDGVLCVSVAKKSKESGKTQIAID
ncbi:MAG: Hsp20 family protein [Gracilibacteraceae bacterium]|jgi:HSP20 family protein|nr:Hsp20 family protein [Gracilibacteraceae bacterium]